MTGLETSIVSVIVGAIIGFVPTYVIDVRRERALRSRWDSPLFELCSEFASTVRGMQELCLRRMTSEPDGHLSDEIGIEHQKLRTLSERLRLLGGLELQSAVGWIVRHAYAVREVSEGRADPEAGRVPRTATTQKTRRGASGLLRRRAQAAPGHEPKLDHATRPRIWPHPAVTPACEAVSGDSGFERKPNTVTWSPGRYSFSPSLGLRHCSGGG